jgi:hypothetical protein
MDRRADLFCVALATRAFLKPAWVRWQHAHGEPIAEVLSSNTCGRSSLFLRNVLRAEGFPAEWANGTPRLSEDGPDIGPFGFFTGHRWESHAWVVSGDLILDITADQFGAPPVIVTSVSDERYRTGSGDTAPQSAIEARRVTVETLWPDWLSHRAQVQLGRHED